MEVKSSTNTIPKVKSTHFITETPPGIHRSRVNIALKVLLFVTIAGLVTMSGLFGQKVSQLGALQNEVAGTCTTPDCLETASQLVSFMNSSADPCKDFYTYACGGFITDNYLPPLSTLLTSVFSKANDDRVNSLTKILSGLYSEQLSQTLFKADPSMPGLYNSVLSYYSTCNTVTPYIVQSLYSGSYTLRYQNNQDQIRNDIKTFVAQNIIQLNSSDPRFMLNLFTTMGRISPTNLAQMRGFDPYGAGVFSTFLFELGVYGIYNPSLSPIVAILTPNLPGGALTDSASVANYSALISVALQLYVYPNKTTAENNATAYQIANFEASVTKLISARPSAVNTTTLTSLDSLQAAYPNIFTSPDDWKMYFSNLGYNDIAAQPSSALIFPTSPSFLQNLSLVLRDSSNQILKDYAAFLAVYQLSALSQLHGFPSDIVFKGYDIGFNVFGNAGGVGFKRKPLVKRFESPSAYQDQNEFNTQSKLRYSVKKDALQPQRLVASHCLADTMEKFPLALGTFYKATQYSDDDILTITSLTLSVKSTYSGMIQNKQANSWLSDTSRANVLRKLNLMKEIIALPNDAQTPGFLSHFYGESVASKMSSSYFNNIITSVQNINMAVGRNSIGIDPGTLTLYLSQDWTEVNAFYEPSMNTLLIPMGILRKNLIAPSVLRSLNYGKLASILGHEISHAFDNNGVQFNEYGDNKPIIDSYTQTQFAFDASCFVNYFTLNFRFGGVPVNGVRTLPENLADNGGLHASWLAYKSLVIPNSNVFLPGLSAFSSDMLFWIGYGQVWCESIDSDLEMGYHTSDVHTINSIRATAAVSLIPGFATTFSCPASPTMASSSNGVCSLWRDRLFSQESFHKMSESNNERQPASAIVHYTALRNYLDSYLQREQQANGITPARLSAREKLKKLHTNQFEELSTDVYDEMNRRNSNDNVGFLSVQKDFHPKRNQARQKLATLSTNRFKDLASDVFAELDRRYPDLERAVVLVDGLTDETTTSSFGGRFDTNKSNGSNNGSSQDLLNDDGDIEIPSAMVNFQSLDNLMADLGNMIASSSSAPEEAPISRNGSTMNISEKPSKALLDQSYQRGVEMARVEANDDNNKRLQDEISKLRSEMSNLKIHLDRATNDASSFKSEKDSLQTSYEEQLRWLRDEIQSLKSANQSLEQRDRSNDNEKESLKTRVQKLEADLAKTREALQSEQKSVSRLQEEIENNKRELAEMHTLNAQLRKELETRGSRQASSPQKAPIQQEQKVARSIASPNLDDSFIETLRTDIVSSSGFIPKSEVVELKEALYELIKAAKTDAPAGVLIAMKTIVVSTRSISEASESFETSTDPAISSSNKKRAGELRDSISLHLNSLMNAAKSHATGSLESVQELYDAAVQLVLEIVDIISVLKIQSAIKSNAVPIEVYSVEQLKGFLEQKTDSIVHNIQTLLMSMKQQSFGTEFNTTIQNIKSVVDNLILVCATSIEQSPTMGDNHRQKGKEVLNRLDESNVKLDQLGAAMISNDTQRPSKQKIAAAAYEVAKFTKELVTLFEEQPIRNK